MKRHILTILCLINSFVLFSWKAPDNGTILSAGTQPQLSMDTKAVIRIVFGRSDSIFCATSKEKGNSFSSPVFVGKVTDMHLGMSRGPQIASSLHSSVITAMDKTGDIHFFQMENNNGKWINKGYVNDLRSSAPEGLMGLTADTEDHFYAVWLDTRREKKNNIFFSSFNGAQTKWSANINVYQSPDGHVCECCKPNIAVRNGKLAIMFRNWLNGSRDLYLAQSANGGKSFTTVKKLGEGTWPLNGCPMDGGGLAFDNIGKIQTTWQRQGNIYTCIPGEPEIKLATGRNSSLTYNKTNHHWLITYQEGENAKLVDNMQRKELITIKGSFMKPLMTGNGKILCVWEAEKTILYTFM